MLSKMFNQSASVFLFLMLTVFLCGSLLFLNGFFPDSYVKMNDNEQNQHGTQRPSMVKGVHLAPPKPKYEQIVLMIVDALGFGFVNPSASMPFVHKNRCYRLKLRVNIPTVTMPRIKSLMTGTVSNFVDILRNLGNTEQLNESLLHVLNKHKRLINFAGDRTWTGLFPTEFTRKRANMDSFFVHDFYEGDRQIIETLRKEINENDWALLILHFLGLDHIGHVEGSHSPKIKEKLIEMDNVISEVCLNQYFENRLLLVTGDHGMREGGGHGGSTEEEMTVPLLIFNKNCQRNNNLTKEYNQIDLTPTLAILMAVEIPKTSIGALIPEMLLNMSQEERLNAFFYNAHHLIHKAYMKYGEINVKETGYMRWYEQAETAHKQFLEAQHKKLPASVPYEQALKNYQRVATEISKRMSESLVKFDYGFISVGIFLTTTVTVYIVMHLIFTEKRQKHCSRSSVIFNISLGFISLITALILNIGSQELDLIVVNSLKRSCLLTVACSIGVFISLKILREFQKLILPLPTAAHLKMYWVFPKPLLAAFFMTIFLLGSSSYIEYEHRTWHYLGVTCLLWLIIINVRPVLCENSRYFGNGQTYLMELLKNKKTQILLNLTILIMLRFLSVLNVTTKRRWSTWMRVFKEFSLSLLFIGSLIFLLRRLRKFLTPFQKKASIGAVISIILFRGFQGQLIVIPELQSISFASLILFWIFICATGFSNYAVLLSKDAKLLENFFTCSILVAALLHQTHNVILLPCLLYVLEHAYNLCDNLKLCMREPYKKRYKLASKTFLTIFIANMFFFYQGNSNSLATIDLNPGYIGQSTYNPVIVAIFVTANTYSAPINAFFYFILHILTNESQKSTYCFEGESDKESESLLLVITLYTVATLLPVAFYLGLMILFRYHLFIYSVYAPKVFYECFSVVVYFLLYCGIHIIKYVTK